jgi:chemotaxis response regulator CheB
MVVDDSESWPDQVHQILEQYPGLQIVATAPNGEEAIIKARLRHSDVIVMDLVFPRRMALKLLNKSRGQVRIKS